MAIYPTKSQKINKRSKKFKVGAILTSIFSVVLILLIFNFFKVFTIFMVGTFGLLIYPVCIFLITIGILLMCNKEIKTSKKILTYSIIWLAIFVLIMQMATSKNIDISFSEYISTTFKNHLTAGGVVFGIILYPIYYLTYDLATYIILIIALVIFTALLIDKIYIELKNNNKTIVKNEQLETEEVSDNLVEDDDEVELNVQNDNTNKDNDDIFISDEVDEQREEAKSILGLSKEKQTYEKSIETNYTEELEKQYKIDEPEMESQVKKPNIYVHEDGFESFSNKTQNQEVMVETKEDINEKRKKDALAYLNISKGKFETKLQKTGFDNVTTKPTIENQDIPFDNIKTENKNRLSELTNKISLIGNNQKESAIGTNPFKNDEVKADIYDESFTKKEFNKNQEKYANNNISLNNAISNLPKMAQKIYSGEVKDNMVDNNSFRPVQVSMNEPVVKKQPQQKLYKKPPTYNRPPIDLLQKYPATIDDDSGFIQEKGQLIVDTLKSFKIDTKIINAVKGPTFTRYELQMAPGISVNTVNNKINDLSMALASSCRPQIPIPGKNAFGIEVPNKKRVTVGLRDIIESQNFQNSKSPLTFALGKDISGTCKVSSIDKLVHTLIAGSTGSGKSVCLNTLLVSLLYKASPDDLRLILVDPKTVEFSSFNNLPHMLIPNTITDCDKAVDALGWLVDEMERRYKKLNSIGVKKISEYNESDEVLSGSVEKMFYIVMIFDEVGDFMTRAKKEIEEKIRLLAAKSRACGIHLVLATQRPTTDVITGTIKANLPSRIAFAVSSYVDSKTILESGGAESLLGLGDMLFLPYGSNDMDRIQGCFIDNKELKSVINYIKENNEAIFDEEIENQMFNKNEGFDPGNGVEDAFDPMLKDCLRYFIKSKKASTSSLQAYFGIGYPKANKIVLQMEKAGFISPGDSSGRRTLYITQQEFEERFGEDLDE